MICDKYIQTVINRFEEFDLTRLIELNMGDIRCPKSVDIDLNEENGCVNHWFRSESELQNEGKGGFLCGKIRVTK